MGAAGSGGVVVSSIVSPQRVALVGCGFTGTSAFRQLVHRYPVREITIFEASGVFGPGYPYRADDCPDYLMNNTTDSLCLEPGNRLAFLEWLRAGHSPNRNVDPRGHLPRRVFGEFLGDSFRQTRALARQKNITLRLVPEEATAVTETSDGVCVFSAAGEFRADVAILTTGRCPDRDIIERPAPQSAASYFPTHIMAPALDELPLDARIHVLGSSLSAFDVINRVFSESSGCGFRRNDDGRVSLEAANNRRTLTLCSRSGRLKAFQSARPAAVRRNRFTLATLRTLAEPGELTLDAVALQLRAEAAGQGVDLQAGQVLDPYAGCRSIQAVNRRAQELLQRSISAARAAGRENLLVDLLADAQLDIWDAFAERLLSAEEERKYRRHYETAVQSYAAPAPVSTGEKLLALVEAGRVRILKGVESVTLRNDGSGYDLRHEFGTEFATRLVNATGAAELDVLSPAQPALVRQLVHDRLMHPYGRDGRSLAGADVDMRTFRACGAANIYLANMLLWGPGFFTSSAFMMAVIVERILKAVYPSPPRERTAGPE